MMDLIKKVHRTKKMQNQISFQISSSNFNYLQSISFKSAFNSKLAAIFKGPQNDLNDLEKKVTLGFLVRWTP